MKLSQVFISCVASLPAILVGVECVSNFQTNDYPYINEFIATKRTIPLDEKGEGLKFSGDVRVDWMHRREVLQGSILRGGGAHDRNGVPIPSDEMAVRFNFRTKYNCKDFYSIVEVECDDLTGIFTSNNECTKEINGKKVECKKDRLFGSGTFDTMCLKRMYFGTTLWKNDSAKWIGEIGRKSLYYTFDSRIQYKARVDGIFTKYTHEYAKYDEGRASNYYFTLGGFVVDFMSKHFSYAFETGVHNVVNSGFDCKTSLIHWRQYHENACGIADPLGWRFINGQVNLDYNFKQKIWGKKLNIYSAFQTNFLGKPGTFKETEEITNPDGTTQIVVKREFSYGHENLAGYIGFIWGEVSKAGDLSFDCTYQYVQAQSIPDCDVRGIGTGNIRRDSFPFSRRGNANFKGVKMELLYAITDLLQVDVTAILSSAINRSFFNGRHSYHAYEIEFVHAF